MANETDTGFSTEVTAADALATLAAREFDPGELLALPPGPPRPPLGADALSYEVGPTVEVIRTFDPAANLGDAARRGPAMIGDGKPLVARIGGVEVVTIPLEHYAALLKPLTLARLGIVSGKGKPDADSMLLFLLSLHADGSLSRAELAQATSLDEADLGDRIAAYQGAQLQPLKGELGEGGATTGTTPEVVAARPAPIDLPSGLLEEVVSTREVATSYDAAVQRGDTLGGAMDRTGKPAPQTGRGEAAHDAERGGQKRSR